MAHRSLVTAAVVLGVVFAWQARPSAAQEPAADGEVRITLPVTLFTPGEAAPPARPAVVEAAPVQFRETKPSSALSRGLMGLYASTAALQVLDIRSTYAVINRGGAEGNPLMARLVSHKAAFVAVKVGIAAATVLAARQVAKKSKLAAVVTLVAMNSVYAAVVSHNYKLAGQLR